MYYYVKTNNIHKSNKDKVTKPISVNRITEGVRFFFKKKKRSELSLAMVLAALVPVALSDSVWPLVTKHYLFSFY